MNFRIFRLDGSFFDVTDADQEQVNDGILILGNVRVPLMQVSHWAMLPEDPPSEESSG